MAKVIAICGKLCAGKSYYAKQLRKKEKAVILSCDELSKQLFPQELGQKHEEMMSRIQRYLRRKAVELTMAGCNVILDWGFWTAESRQSISAYFALYEIPVQWHYLQVDDECWQQNIRERNDRILSGEAEQDYFVDEGLLQKFLEIWEAPTEEEFDVVYRVFR